MRTSLKLLISAIFLAGLVQLSVGAAAQSRGELSMDQLLNVVREGRVSDTAENSRRLAEFRREQANQQRLLTELKKEEQTAEALSEAQEKAFEENDMTIAATRDRLNERLGALKELFGVLQQVSSDAQGQFYGSLTQLQYPERADYLSDFSEKMGQTTVLPSIEEIERLWFELQREMTESGKVVRRQQAVVTTSGEERQQDVIRVGKFNIVSEGKYLHFVPETGRVLEYSRQPAARFLEGAEEIDDASAEVVPFTIDPTRGQLLSLLVAAPNLKERVAQGGVIGYVIMGLGVIAVILAILRFIYLLSIQSRINKQIKHPQKAGNNPLGRILKEYISFKDRDLETLELKMGEAVLREVPPINRGLSFLKIIAAVAPLLGLLGTVTGMIITFQSIVLFGAGDPKMMAGGISQALVTTVLGLTVAIPTLLLHNLVQTRAKAITDVLEQEAVAIIASQSEKHARAAKQPEISEKPVRKGVLE